MLPEFAAKAGARPGRRKPDEPETAARFAKNRHGALNRSTQPRLLRHPLSSTAAGSAGTSAGGKIDPRSANGVSTPRIDQGRRRRKQPLGVGGQSLHVFQQFCRRNRRRSRRDQLTSEPLKILGPHARGIELGDRLPVARPFLEFRVEVDRGVAHHSLETITKLGEDLSRQLGPHVVLVRENADGRPPPALAAQLLDGRKLPSQPVQRKKPVSTGMMISSADCSPFRINSPRCGGQSTTQ